ncbi:MAG: hypothetical protein R3C70_17720 [Geminicoccaceae bacterium]
MRWAHRFARARRAGTAGGGAAVPSVVASSQFIDCFSLQSGTYITGVAGTHNQPSGGEDRCLVAIILYQAHTAQARSFTAPTFNGVPMTEALAPTSPGDKGRPGVAIYVLPDPSTGSHPFDFSAGENLMSCIAVLVSLTGVDQADPIDIAGGASDAGDAATIATTLAATGSGLLLGGAAFQGHDGHAATGAGLDMIRRGVSNTANLWNDQAFYTGSKAVEAAGDVTASVTFATSDGRGDGWCIIRGSGSVGGGGTGVVVEPPSGLRFVPPTPAATLDIVTVVPGSDIVATGTPTKDALVVMPATQITQQFSVQVLNYRRVFMIGGSMRVVGRGTKQAPDGRMTRGQNWFFYFQTAQNAVDAGIYVARLHIENDPDTINGQNSQYGDIFNFGAKVNGSNNNFSAWPDIWLDSILMEGGLYGWAKDLVAHSDFFKSEAGGYKSLWVNRLDVKYGYQHFYLTPTWISDYTAHPTGETHFYDTVLRQIRTRGSGSSWWYTNPKAFYFSRGSVYADAGQYYPTTFHEGGADGSGVWMPGAADAINAVHPRGGEWGPRWDGGDGGEGVLLWPWGEPVPGRGRIVSGHLWLDEPPEPVITAEGVGISYRITSKAELESLIASF